MKKKPKKKINIPARDFKDRNVMAEILGVSEWIRCDDEVLELMAASRTMVPELARRLKEAIELLRDAAKNMEHVSSSSHNDYLERVADDLEKTLEEL